MYHYAGNNPVRYIDPDGNSPKAAVLGWIGTDLAVPEPTDVCVWKWLGYGAAFFGACVIEHFAVKAVSNALSKTQDNDNSKSYVYHSTNFQPFIDALMTNGNTAIDKSKTSSDSRFGQQFYVASDPATARAEATSVGPLIKFSMSENSVILDLTNPSTADAVGYKPGMSRAKVRDLMSTWNLSGVDAIKYPSEKNPGGSNYAVLNPLILKPEGVE